VNAPSTLNFDIHDVPFSRRGSWLDISPVVGLHAVSDHLHLVSHHTGMHAIFVFQPERDGRPVSAEFDATPAELAWSVSGGSIEAVFESETAIRLRGRGMDLRVSDASSDLTPFSGSYYFHDPIDGAAIFTSYETGRRYRVTSLSGALTGHGAQALGAGERAVTAHGAQWEIVIEEFATSRAPYAATTTFDAARSAVADEFDRYVDAVAPWRSRRTPAAATAAYVLWSATVSPSGYLEREAILMSKHWMDKVWSWDHCFNALALAPGLPAEAVDQYRIVFDFQERDGALPDSVAHSEVLYNFVKPPIHGWALRKLRRALSQPIDPVTLRELYGSLALWTRFWLENRRVPGHALPHYQHGNDSGWDNSSTFDLDRVIESPDLAAFMAVQLSALTELADELELADDGAVWQRERDQILTALDELWDGDTYVARAATTGRHSKKTSLLNNMPIVAAAHLTPSRSDALALRVTSHLTDYGLSTQLVDTDDYESDGYWRGPIWAPSTAIIEDGLRQAGHTELADQVSERFRRLCEKSGFAENFDALTGAGLRDRAYTWTASVYLTLAREAEGRLEEADVAL